MVAFFASVIVLAVLVGLTVWYTKRRPADQYTTWGEAMLGATWVFLMLFWAFGVVPHQFIVWADSELGWRNDQFIVGPGEILADLPFDIPYTALRDVIVVGIHVVLVGGLIKLVLDWQRRGETVEEPEPASRFGRPLVSTGNGSSTNGGGAS